MPEEIDKNTFPKDFMWGASTAAHQVEGDNYNDWSVWEMTKAERLAATVEQRLKWLPSWAAVKPEAVKKANYISGKGVEHYDRYEKDFDLVKKLNMNAFRFTLEWSRIEPRPGVWDQAAIDHYKNYIKALRARNIEPIMNIWHWTVPVWFAKMGGFEHRRNLFYFERFVHKVAQELIADVDYVLTLNEPNVYASFSYQLGLRPPQKQNALLMLRVYRHLAITHRRCYYILKHEKSSLKIGVAAQLANIQAKRAHSFGDEFVTQWMRYAWNWWFLRRIRREQDFIGLNYYFTDYYRFRLPPKPENPKLPVNDLGWYMEPEGIYPLLLRVWAHYKKPILITENGVADGEDQYRRWWIEETIVALERALSEGVKVIGYLHWSLLDNFEWEMGWWPKFGLIEVDRATMKRKIRPSAKWFAAQIKRIQQ